MSAKAIDYHLSFINTITYWLELRDIDFKIIITYRLLKVLTNRDILLRKNILILINVE